MMKAFILLSLALLTNVITGCASEGPKPILEERAGYGSKLPPFQLDKTEDRVRYVPTRVPEKVAVAWLYAHEMPSRDYFWGSWISVVVSSESWQMAKVEIPKEERNAVKENPRPHAAAPKSSKKPTNQDNKAIGKTNNNGAK